MSTVTVTLSVDAHALICALVQPTVVVDSEYVEAPDDVWEEVRQWFPARGFTHRPAESRITLADW